MRFGLFFSFFFKTFSIENYFVVALPPRRSVVTIIRFQRVVFLRTIFFLLLYVLLHRRRHARVPWPPWCAFIVTTKRCPFVHGRVKVSTISKQRPMSATTVNLPPVDHSKKWKKKNIYNRTTTDFEKFRISREPGRTRYKNNNNTRVRVRHTHKCALLIRPLYYKYFGSLTECVGLTLLDRPRSVECWGVGGRRKRAFRREDLRHRGVYGIKKRGMGEKNKQTGKRVKIPRRRRHVMYQQTRPRGMSLADEMTSVHCESDGKSISETGDSACGRTRPWETVPYAARAVFITCGTCPVRSGRREIR